jgi:pyruvate/2-oxoglutarate dehydrogenase complex dihydrolipoamide acyltransferase (E2) component
MYIVKYPEKGRHSDAGIVVAWAKKAGDSVKQDDLLLTVESSCECLEILSSADGTVLAVLAETGRPVAKGQPLGLIGPAGQDVSAVVDRLRQAASPTAPMQTTPSPKAAQPNQSTPKQEAAMTPPQTNGNPANVTPVLMPQAGQSMEEGTILAWKVNEGDMIAVGQVIMEIETDKATMEVEAPDAGRLGRILHGAGDIVEVKKPVALLADSDADIDAYLAGAGIAAPAAAPASTPAAAPAAAPQAASVPDGAVKPILMPQAGQSMEEGTILAWKVAEGDVIEVGQVIMEIETDKATMEVEAVDAGRIARIVAAEGDIVEVKVPVAYIAEEGVDLDAYIAGGGAAAAAVSSAPAQAAPAAAAPKAAAKTQKAAASVSRTGRVKASPAARKAAAEMGIDLASIPAGSGPGGASCQRMWNKLT